MNEQIAMIAFWYVLATYIMGFKAFALGENNKLSLVGLILFFFSPLVFPLLVLVLVAKLLADVIRSATHS